MKFAAVSDIHGNLPALEAVRADMATQGVDAVVNLGDILSGPLWPAETAELLMPLGWPTLAGNHERQVLTQPPEAMGPTDRHTLAQLGPAHRAWLATLPGTLAWQPDVLLCHGTPQSDLVYWLETVTDDFGAGPEANANGSPHAEPGVRPATSAEATERAGDALLGVPHGLILCGHTHVPRCERLPDGRWIVNPGSVGLQAYDDDHPHPHVIENGHPAARYALITRKPDGWVVKLRRVAYDHEAAARQAERHGRPDWAHALRTGRVGPRGAD